MGGCLAAMATHAKQLSTAEIAYAAVDAVDKVAQIQYIKSLPTQESRNAEMALLSNQAQEAESLLLQSGLIYRAIDMNCSLCRWDRALDLAIKHKTHVDTVLGLRQQHLQAMGQRESLPRFIEYAERVDADWTAVEAKIAEEWDPSALVRVLALTLPKEHQQSEEEEAKQPLFLVFLRVKMEEDVNFIQVS